MLTPEQEAKRKGKLTASRVACLVRGDKQEIYDLWREMTDDPTYTRPERTEDVEWFMALGSATEPVHLDWLERTYGPITRRGEVVTHPVWPWAAATLDGAYCPAGTRDHSHPVEAKHVGGFEKRSEVLERYMPQMHWQMIVTQTTHCVFSVIEGNRKPRHEIITLNRMYANELVERALLFMKHVERRTEPVKFDPIAAPIEPVKEYDMDKSNAWGHWARLWIQSEERAKTFNEAERELKELMPKDAIIAIGHGVKVTRDRANRLKISPHSS